MKIKLISILEERNFFFNMKKKYKGKNYCEIFGWIIIFVDKLRVGKNLVVGLVMELLIVDYLWYD